MAVGFYVTVQRLTNGQPKYGWLLGPYDTELDARADIPTARRLAELVDPRTVFDAFGTAKLTRDGALPPGVLNRQLEKWPCFNSS